MVKSHKPDAEHQVWVEGLVARYEKPLCAFACSLVRDPDRARDAVQETFLRLCRESQNHLAGRETGWLFRVCRTRCIDILRKENPVSPLSMQEQAALPSPMPGPDVHARQHDLLDQLPAMMNSLPEKQRNVVRLKFQQHLSYKEIAETLELSVSNVGFLLHTAIHSLRQNIQAVEGA